MAMAISEEIMAKIIDETKDHLSVSGSEAYTSLRRILSRKFSGLSSREIVYIKNDKSWEKFYGCDAFLELLEFVGFKIEKIRKDGCLHSQYVTL